MNYNFLKYFFHHSNGKKQVQHILLKNEFYICVNIELINITKMNTKTFCGECKNTTDAAKNGHLDCLQYAHENGCEWDEWTCTYAAKNGHLDCLVYAHDNGCRWDEWACIYAAEYGHLDCLEYAHINGCEWDKWTCTHAVKNGHLECLQYAHENGCPWDEDTCAYAAFNGQLECLRYAHKNGCPWDEYTCDLAAQKGQLQCLVYAHKNKCLWDDLTCVNAAEYGHLACLEYAHDNGCPCIHNTGKLKIYSTELDTTTDNEDIQCGICYEKRNKVQYNPCNHTLCIACSNTIIYKNTEININCPFCRGEVEENLLLKS